jgi:serine protease Do
VQSGSGSGIILTSDGYIITCRHVVNGAETIKVILNDDTEYEATLIGSDSRSDLAVIKINATGLTPATLGDSDMLTVGEDVIAIGNPLGELRGTATSGIISALSREVTVENTDMTLIQTDAAISPGNSGGGLFNASGSLIGIVNAKASSSNSEGLGFAIPVSSVKTIISNLIDHGYVLGRAYLGVYTQDVTLSTGSSDGSNRNGNGLFGNFFGSAISSVQIAQVVTGSAADAAGLKAGDLILKIDDMDITSNTVLAAAISAYNAGDTVTLTIQRDGSQLTLNVTFGEYKPAEQ